METSTKLDCEELRLWAREEFGAAALGNKLRSERLVAMAASVAAMPAGRVTEVFGISADREAAYRFLENPNIDERDVARAAHGACARRSVGMPFVFVATDGCTLTVADSAGDKGFGPVGTTGTKARGAEAMNAIAVSPDGTPLGLCGQIFWTRSKTVQQRPSHQRKLHEKETRYWLKCIEDVNEAFATAKVETPRWFQLDAGADFRELLALAAEAEQHVTVRAAQNRRVADGDDLLWETVAAETPLGRFTLTIPRGRKRQAREATLEIRSRSVRLKLPRLGEVDMHAVLVEEVDTTPEGEEPISWLLLTNFKVLTFDDARLVVYGYSQRWRVEEFHKSWKSVCRVEESQLDVTAFKPWAVILASFAMRIERLKYLARNESKTPATAELSETELKGIIALKGRHRPKDYVPGKIPTIAQAVRWIAELGGYTGKSSGGPAGTIVIGRGLQRVEIAAQVIANLTADGTVKT